MNKRVRTYGFHFGVYLPYKLKEALDRLLEMNYNAGINKTRNAIVREALREYLFREGALNMEEYEELGGEL